MYRLLGVKVYVGIAYTTWKNEPLKEQITEFFPEYYLISSNSVERVDWSIL